MTITIPASMISGTSIYRATWGDLVAVSARHWGDAASPIYYDGKPSQWQVADFRHNSAAAAADYFADDVEEIDISFADGGLTLAAWEAAEAIYAAAEDVILDADDEDDVPSHITALYEAADVFAAEHPAPVAAEVDGEGVGDAMHTVINAAHDGEVDSGVLSDPERAAEVVDALDTLQRAKEAADEALDGLTIRIKD